MKLTTCLAFIFILFTRILLAQSPDSLFAKAGTVDPIKIIGSIDSAALKIPVVTGPEIWKDPTEPIGLRVKDLISRMSLAEKTSLLLADEAAIPRLGIPAYSFRNEGIHGYMARLGYTTMFPQVIGMAATWNANLIKEEANVIATEARAHFNDYTSKHEGNSIMHEGISLYAPNVNLVRDPRWGRGQETYGEDPFLTSKLSLAYIEGLQGNNPKYIKALACAKHFAVHSGPEPMRHVMNMIPSKQDLYDTYLPTFEVDIREGHAGSVMSAYSALYGKPDCADPFLLTKLLRKQWGFNGFVVSDGGAITDIWAHHKYVTTPEEAVTAALKAGCDLFSGAITNTGVGKYPFRDYEVLGRTLKQGLVSESLIDSAISKTLAARFQLGLFDPPEMVPWSKITLKQNDTPGNKSLALKAAEESIVLLKNNGIIPLNKEKLKNIAVVGANANSVKMLLGNYEGNPPHPVTILEGIKEAAGDKIKIIYEEGCPLAIKNDDSNKPTKEAIDKVVDKAKTSDIIIYVGGLDATLEREQNKVDYQGFYGGDRTKISLPSVQEDLIKALYKTGKPVIFINCSGSAIAMKWEAKNIPAIIQAWYPGEEGGTAVANVLFGDYNPAGRLPVTFYKSVNQLPPFTDYRMKDRTYRYFTGTPLYPFGFGLSYTSFKYSSLKVSENKAMPDDTIKVSVSVKNTGKLDGDEVVQLYVKNESKQGMHTIKSLKGFKRVFIKKGDTKTVEISLPISEFKEYNVSMNKLVVEPGKYEIQIGSSSRDIKLKKILTVK